MTTIAKVIHPITACLKKPETTKVMNEDNPAESPGNDKISNEVDTEVKQPQAGLIWRMSSQLYTIGTGAVGLGVGTVKWAASTTYTVGTGVVSATQTVVGKVIPSTSPKPKKE